MSGHAIKGSLPIKGDYAKYHASCIINNIKKYLNINAITLGSTGKKSSKMSSGDIDIGIEMIFNKENIESVKNFIYKLYAGKYTDIYVSEGFKIVSFGLIYNDMDEQIDKIVQVDLMFSMNLEYTAFMYHSPNYIFNESKFKGLYRTNLLCYIVGRIPTGIEDLYYEDGRIKDYWKYTLTYDRGMVLTHKSYEGKTKRLSTPKTKESILVTDNINDIITYALGKNADISTTNSFESLIDYLFSDNYIYDKSVLNNIMSDYLEDFRQEPELKNILKYIVNIINNKIDIDKLKNEVYNFLS